MFKKKEETHKAHTPVHATHKATKIEEEVIGARAIKKEQAEDTPSGEKKIVIKDKTFSPKSFDAKVGELVTWYNDGKDTHCVTFTPESADTPGCVAPPSSNDIPPAGIYQYAFTVPGSYEYTCGHHKGMVGTVNVT